MAHFGLKYGDIFCKFGNMKNALFILLFITISGASYAQLTVSRDTISVLENGYTLKMPWGNGINYANISNIDLNYDGRMDVVAFDRINLYGVGKFRCFVQTAALGTYTINHQYSYQFPFTVYWALCLDYDTDGKADIFCSTPAGIKVYKNTGSVLTGLQFTLEKSILYSNYPPGINLANIYAASNGVPGISDIDNDTDLDILTFSPSGNLIEFHKNLSVETYGHNDSLNKFQIANNCWGEINQTNCGIAPGQTCSPVVPKFSIPDTNRHAGSCLTCVDTDGDLDKDLIIGDLGCNITLYGHNTGSLNYAIITQTTNQYPNFPAVANTTQIAINNFPCTYYVDVDGDNRKDLVASPNANGGENYQSVWYYRNTSLTSTVNFQFVKKTLFQDEMIEVGQNSFPVIFDENGDGKKDLLVGTHGYYVPVSLRGRLTLYRNVGTNAVPAYSLITRDFAGISTQSLNGVMPTAGDIDNDGDVDIVIGTQTGQLRWLENTAGAGNPCNFSVLNPTLALGTTSSVTAPQLFDIDADGKLDLMVGLMNGKIAFYKNVGSGTPLVPSFILVSANFGSVSVLGDQNLYSIQGFASPHFFNDGTGIKLLVGSVSGNIFYYSVPSATANCNLINANVNSINEGGQSTVFYEDVNNDGKRDLFIGNGSGGLSFFSSLGPDVALKEQLNENSFIHVFPNPTAHILNIRIDKIEVESGLVILTDVLGKQVFSKKINSNFESLNVDNLASGIYILKINISSQSQNYTLTQKIIKE